MLSGVRLGRSTRCLLGSTAVAASRSTRHVHNLAVRVASQMAQANPSACNTHVRAFSEQATPSTPPTDLEVDVAIVGGGIVGAAMAASLGSSNTLKDTLSVALIDGSKGLPSESPSGLPDIRVFALNQSSMDVLKDVGALDSMDTSRVHEFTKMKVWDDYSLGMVSFCSSEAGTKNLGYMVENGNCLSGLGRVLENSPSVKSLFNQSVENVKLGSTNLAPESENDNRGVLELASGQKIKAKLLIGADGGRSLLRSAAEIDTVGWSYNQKAVVCTLLTEEPSHTAYQKFVRRGPIAVLPLWDHFSSIVWHTTPEEADFLCSLETHEFMERLQESLEKQTRPSLPLPSIPNLSGIQTAVGTFLAASKLPSFVPAPPSIDIPSIQGVASARVSFPLKMEHANSYVQSRLALIGDAAHSVNPLAGQGLNLGLGDVKSLTRVLEKAVHSGVDVGSSSMLEEYETERQISNVAMMSVIEATKRAFDVSIPPVAVARNVGMSIVNSFPPLKNEMARAASGRAPFGLDHNALKNVTTAAKSVSRFLPNPLSLVRSR